MCIISDQTHGSLPFINTRNINLSLFGVGYFKNEICLPTILKYLPSPTAPQGDPINYYLSQLEYIEAVYTASCAKGVNRVERERRNRNQPLTTEHVT